MPQANPADFYMGVISGAVAPTRADVGGGGGAGGGTGMAAGGRGEKPREPNTKNKETQGKTKGNQRETKGKSMENQWNTEGISMGSQGGTTRKTRETKENLGKPKNI